MNRHINLLNISTSYDLSTLELKLIKCLCKFLPLVLRLISLLYRLCVCVCVVNSSCTLSHAAQMLRDINSLLTRK